jgi:hypothetical protein
MIGTAHISINMSEAHISLFRTKIRLSDPDCFEQVASLIKEQCGINKCKTHDVSGLPKWAQNLIGYLIEDGDFEDCNICGEFHQSGYVCGCGHDNSHTVLYPVEKYKNYGWI